METSLVPINNSEKNKNNQNENQNIELSNNDLSNNDNLSKSLDIVISNPNPNLNIKPDVLENKTNEQQENKKQQQQQKQKINQIKLFKQPKKVNIFETKQHETNQHETNQHETNQQQNIRMKYHKKRAKSAMDIYNDISGSYFIEYERNLESLEDYKNSYNETINDIDNLKRKIAMSRIFENKHDFDKNIAINGFGIIICRENNVYKVLYNREDRFRKEKIEGKIFRKYDLVKNKLFLIFEQGNLEDDVNDTSIDHQLIIKNRYQLYYNKDYLIDFNKELFENNDFKDCRKKREVKEILTKLINTAKMKRETHSRAAKLYGCRNKIFVIPAIIISALSGITSFIASSEVIAPETKTYLGIFVGVMATAGTFLQSMSGALNYSGKQEAHTIATDEYDNIKTILNFERQNPNESITDTNKFYDSIKNSILNIKKKCNYIIPEHIVDKYLYNHYNQKFKHIKYDILEEAYEKKATFIKKKINSEKNKNHKDIKLGKIYNDISYVIPIEKL